MKMVRFKNKISNKKEKRKKESLMTSNDQLGRINQLNEFIVVSIINIAKRLMTQTYKK